MSSRGNKSSAALIEARRTRLLELKQQGVSTVEAEEILQREGFPANRVTLWRDLRGMMVKFEANNTEAFQLLKKEQDEVLRKMEELLLTEQVHPDVAREWRAIRKDISELWGLDAPAKSVTTRVDAVPLETNFYRWAVSLFDQVDDQAGLKAACEAAALPFKVPRKPMTIEVPAHILADGA